MKRKFLLLILCCPFSIYLIAQENTTNNLETRLTILEEKLVIINDLQIKYDVLNIQTRKTNKNTYDALYLNIKKGVELQNEISNIYDKIDKLIEKDEVDNTLNRVNNPTSEVLGFKFSDVILNSAKDVFDKKEFKNISESKKNKFLSIVGKIVNNPIVGSVASSFPLTGTIRSVITATATFFSEPILNLKTETKKGNLTDATIISTSDDGFSNEFIKQYLNILLPYLTFYETLENANLDYELAISDLRKRNKNLGDLINNTNNMLVNSLGLPENPSLVNKLDRVESAFKFSQSSNNDFNYYEILERSDINKANNVSKQIGLLALDLSNFYSEYIQIQKSKYEKYISALNDAKLKLPINKDDKQKVELAFNSVILEIDKIINDDGLNIFKKEFENIKSLREQLIY